MERRRKEQHQSVPESVYNTRHRSSSPAAMAEARMMIYARHPKQKRGEEVRMESPERYWVGHRRDQHFFIFTLRAEREKRRICCTAAIQTVAPTQTRPSQKILCSHRESIITAAWDMKHNSRSHSNLSLCFLFSFQGSNSWEWMPNSVNIFFFGIFSVGALLNWRVLTLPEGRSWAGELHLLIDRLMIFSGSSLK